ncbi:MAG: 6-phosphogluconolactonase [Leptolyngbyaceae cyanobacterium]
MAASVHVEVHDDRAALVERARILVVDQIKTAIADRGICYLALAGGSTPKPLYEALAQETLPWSRLHIFWGDERYVPIDHPDSNAGMAKAAWLDQVSLPAEQVYPVPTTAATPQAAADQYQTTVETVMGQTPIFDVVLLGMGDDGHTASLFPHTPALAVSDCWVTVGNKGDNPRITFTVPLINQSRCVMFLVSGANKQTALKAVFAETADSQQYPSRLIQPQGELWWLLDQAAGAALED